MFQTQVVHVKKATFVLVVLALQHHLMGLLEIYVLKVTFAMKEVSMLLLARQGLMVQL